MLEEAGAGIGVEEDATGATASLTGVAAGVLPYIMND